MMKNAFFMLKAVFVFEIITFLSRLFCYVEKRLYKKAWVNLKIHDVTDWATNILSNISRSKGNQTIKFGQLID